MPPSLFSIAVILEAMCWTTNSGFTILSHATRITMKNLQFVKLHDGEEAVAGSSVKVLFNGTSNSSMAASQPRRHKGITEASLRDIWKRLGGTDQSISVNKRMFIKAIRNDEVVAEFFGLPGMKIRQEDGTRDKMEKAFQDLDKNDDREIEWKEFCAGYNRPNLPFDPPFDPEAFDPEPPASGPAKHADTQPDMESLWPVGTQVRLQELSVAELNGQVGVIAEIDMEAQRYIVNLHGGERIVKVKFDKVTPDDSKPHPETNRGDSKPHPESNADKGSPGSGGHTDTPADKEALRRGTQVRLHGLRQAAHMNGEVGVIVDIDKSSRRYTVNLQSGGGKTSVRVKFQNVLLTCKPGLIDKMKAIDKALQKIGGCESVMAPHRIHDLPRVSADDGGMSCPVLSKGYALLDHLNFDAKCRSKIEGSARSAIACLHMAGWVHGGIQLGILGSFAYKKQEEECPKEISLTNLEMSGEVHSRHDLLPPTDYAMKPYLPSDMFALDESLIDDQKLWTLYLFDEDRREVILEDIVDWCSYHAAFPQAEVFLENVKMDNELGIPEEDCGPMGEGRLDRLLLKPQHAQQRGYRPMTDRMFRAFLRSVKGRG